MSLFLSPRFQDQVGDASVGPKNLMPLFGMLDGVANVPLELALLGNGSASTPCLFSCMRLFNHKFKDLCISSRLLHNTH